MKITINNNNSFLDVYQSESGKLVFEMGSTDLLNPVGFGTFETDGQAFLELLKKLLDK